MTASLVMDSHPSVLHMDETISKGVELVMDHRYRAIPIVNDKGGFEGIFGVNCLLRLVLPKALFIERGLTTVPFVSDTLRDLRVRLKEVEDKPVTYCMNHDVAVVSPDTPLVETLLTLYNTRQSIPVVDPANGQLLGMISYWDVGARILDQEI